MTNLNTVSGMDKSPRILVADDYEVNQKIAQLILQKSGYRVDIVENGQQAVETCQQNHYDLILMDINMPLMDGHEATKRIRKWEKKLKAESSKLKAKKELKAQSRRSAVSLEDSKPNEKDSEEISAFSVQPSARAQRVPIIAMTGSAAPGSFDETLYPGMNDCIGKPLRRDFLLPVVKKWISLASKTCESENPADSTPPADQRSGNTHLPLDLDRAIQEFMGQKKILIGVLQKFVTSARLQIDIIRRSIQSTDYGAIGSEAHAIKGAAANLRADNLARLASDLEQAAEKQQPEQTSSLADKLKQEFNCLEKYIQQIIESRNFN
jgi:CheY-like chemotaxis protein